MSEQRDILERARDRDVVEDDCTHLSLIAEMADEIDSLRAQLAIARDALNDIRQFVPCADKTKLIIQVSAAVTRANEAFLLTNDRKKKCADCDCYPWPDECPYCGDQPALTDESSES